MIASQAAIDLIKRFEGLRLSPYLDSAGYATVGFGHKLRPGEYHPSGLTELEADALLVQDIRSIQSAVWGLLGDAQEWIGQNQFDALVSFTFNLGPGALERSTLLRDILDGQMSSAAEQFALWDHAGGVVERGLVERRAAEREMFVG